MTKVLSLDNLVLHIRNFSKTDMVSSEANTKNRIIEPLLEILGWDLLSNEVRLEYPVRIGTKSSYVDYALMLEDKPVVLVEAKPFDATLSDDYGSQIISYGRVEDVHWAALTNGRILKVFDTKAGKTEKDCFVVGVDLEKLPQQASELRLLSRESILTGEIEKTARRLATTKKAIRSLRRRQQDLANEFEKALLGITGPGLENRVRIVSSQLANQAVQLFEQKAEAPRGYERTFEGPMPSEIQSIDRKSLSQRPPGEVILCPSKIEGVEFLKKYNAWGFVNISKRRRPKYFALYVGRPESSVLYFGEVDSITKPLQSKEELTKMEEEDTWSFETGKRVVHLRQGSLVRFVDPIRLKNRKMAPRALRYTTLEKLIESDYLEEL